MTGWPTGNVGLRLQMAASYQVTIDVERSKRELATLDSAIRSLGSAMLAFSNKESLTVTRITQRGGDGSGSFGKSGVFVTMLERMEGRIQPRVQNIMANAMKDAIQRQATILDEATTAYGTYRMSIGKGRSAGRNDTGAMIRALSRNVEIERTVGNTVITGWHGWKMPDVAGKPYFRYQERGTSPSGRRYASNPSTRKRAERAEKSGAKGRGIQAANSLGKTVSLTRTYLKKSMKGIAR